MDVSQSSIVYLFDFNPFCDRFESCLTSILTKSIGVSTRQAAAILSSLPPTKREIKKLFQGGRLPSSFSQTSLWVAILSNLDRLQLKIENQHSAIAEEQNKLEMASRETQNTLRVIQELTQKVRHFEEAQRVHAAAIQTLQDELQQWKKLNIASLKKFAQLAADVEKELVTQLEDQDRKSTRLNSSHPSISRMPSSA